ncbi:MAG: YidC/Oxa1 family insertase periplasmic-domain containing protein [Myxococcales bacterium]|nr:YidC/Oxa1 family insertase periplasmic-domain containing protein [Myxococcales bacterium]
MEDQGKRLLLAAALAILVMFVWGKLFPPPQPTKPADTATTTATTETKPIVAERLFGTLPDDSKPAAIARSGRTHAARFDKISAEFSDVDAAITQWNLLDPQFVRSEQKGRLVEPSHPALTLNFIRSTAAIPAGATWQTTENSDRGVTYTYRDADMVVTKRFTVDAHTFSVRLAVELENIGTRTLQQRMAISVPGAQDPKGKTQAGMGGEQARDWRAACSRDEKVHNSEVIKCSAYRTTDAGNMVVDIEYPPFTLKPGDPPIKRELVAYIGPKFYDRLEAVDAVAGFNTHARDAVDFGWLSAIARPMLWILQKSYGFLGSWGFSIIFLTFLVKLATLYWTNKSMRSMKAMSALKPKLEDLQKKYADDKQRLNTEMMALYKTHGVNPVAGCLPMLLQMPIWFALYRMLSTAGELYHAKFFWLSDLTAADPLYILPVVLTGTMFIQSRLTPVAGDAMQQKMLMYGMPLLFGVMSFFFPSGLSVYILTNTLLTIGHTMYMNRNNPAAISAPAGGGGGALATVSGVIDSDDEGSTDVLAAAPSNGDLRKQGAGKSPSKQQPRNKRKTN